jgi:hypothetical protein
VKALALLVLPWVIALALELFDHLNDTGLNLLAAASIGLPAIWLAYVPVRNTSKSDTPSIGQVVQQRPGVTGKPVRLDDPPLLAGRENLLAELHTRLSAGDGPWPRIVALTGLGGVGKTSVALAYARRHLVEVGVAWQFAAEDPTVVADGFGQLAAQLGVRDVVDTRDPVASVHAVLAVAATGWLLLFDNAPDLESCGRSCPRVGPGDY